MRITPFRRAREVLDVTGTPTTNAAIDVNKICKHYKITLGYVDLPNSISGMLQRDGEETAIYINMNHPPTRQRFTIAHELGHFFLNHTQGVHVDKFIPLFRDEESGKATSSIEIDANRFAAELLMPESMVRNYLVHNVNKTSDEDSLITEMAKKFGISKVALTIRLQNLKIQLAGY